MSPKKNEDGILWVWDIVGTGNMVGTADDKITYLATSSSPRNADPYMMPVSLHKAKRTHVVDDHSILIFNSK